MDDTLQRFIAAAKHAVYNQQRASQFLPMLDTRNGAINAVMSVIAALETKKPVPVQMVGMLAVNIYLMMVDVAMAATGTKPDKSVMKETIGALLEQLKQSFGKPQPKGLLAGAQ